MKRLILIAIAGFSIGLLATSSPAQTAPAVSEAPAGHILLGAWLATDGTVFIFRKDGTFHGFDYQHKEIWGSWVTLSASRIGFQSLLHDSSYRPQYAIIDKANRDSMNYIVTGGTNFIKATRIPVEKAEATVESVVEPQVHHPDDDKNE